MKCYRAMTDAELLLRCDNLRGHSPIIDELAERLSRPIHGTTAKAEVTQFFGEHTCPVCESPIHSRVSLTGTIHIAKAKQ